MMVRKGELCDVVCATIGITRKRYGQAALTKRELERLVSYLMLTKPREKKRSGDQR